MGPTMPTRHAITAVCPMVTALLVLLTPPLFAVGQSRDGLIGPGQGNSGTDHIVGRFAKWERRATPMLVLRVHGAGTLQTFAEISATGEFKLPLPQVPAAGNFGSVTCGDRSKGLIVVATDVSLLTRLPGFTSPGRWDRGFSEIGMAVFADDAFARNIGKPGGKRAQWMHSFVARTVGAGECNNTNSFPLEAGWNAYTVVSGSNGGPHTYRAGLADDMGWYWSAFPEDAATPKAVKPPQPSGAPAPGETDADAKWLAGEWQGVQVDVRMQMRLQSSGAVWLESIEGGRKQTMEGKWSLNNGEFVLDIRGGMLRFNIKRTSDTGFRLFGKDASSDILFTRKK